MTMTLAKMMTFYASPEGGRLVNEVREHARTEAANRTFLQRAAQRFNGIQPSNNIPFTIQH